MRMNQVKKNLKKGVFFLIILGCQLFSCPTDAAQLYFPYYADTWPQVDTKNIGIILLQGNSEQEENANQSEEEQKSKNQKKKKKQNKKQQEKKEKKKKQQKKQKDSGKDILSAKDKEILYKVVSMECDTGYEGSLAVISCMLNRQASRKYPDDLMDVVREDSQFTAYYDKETGTYPYIDREPSKECIAAVDDALEKGKRNIPSYIYYFRSSDYDYLNGYITYGQIGDNTYFYQYEDQ